MRRLFIKHESEWIKRDYWPRLKETLVNQPNLYQYAMQVHNNMAWIEEATAILGDTKPWFIHPAGMMELVGKQKSGFIFTLEIMKRIYTSFHNNIVRDGDLQEVADELNSNLDFYQLDTPLKRTRFFAQILQETGPNLNVVEGGVWHVSAIKSFSGGRTRRDPDGRLYADVHGYVTKIGYKLDPFPRLADKQCRYLHRPVTPLHYTAAPACCWRRQASPKAWKILME